MDGAQISLSVALVVQIVVLFIGLPIGAIAGWFGGRDRHLPDALHRRHVRVP